MSTVIIELLSLFSINSTIFYKGVLSAGSRGKDQRTHGKE